MKRKWKSLLLAINWLILSLGTAILIILTQPLSVPAQVTTPPSQESPAPQPTATENEEKQPTSESGEATPEEEPALSPEELARQQRFIEADKLYLAGNTAAAEKIYREVKEPFSKTVATTVERKPAIVDPAQLSPGGRVFWREGVAGLERNLQTKALVPLQLLVEQYPEFVPGHLRYAEALKKYDRTKEALDTLERATSLYPDQPDLVTARVQALAEAKKWMEASLAARQFAILNPQSPQVEEFSKLADENLKRYRAYIQEEIRGNTIANIITGAVGYAVTGSLIGPFSALDSTIMLLQGEQSIGESVANQARKQLDLIVDEPTLAYVNDIGQKLAKIAGRDEFKYEFFVIPDESLNAFALPGGKIFVHAGAIAKTDSEAELAGLLAHELSHVVLSHGFQLVTQGNLISNVTQYLPLGGIIGQLSALSYSRDMERQADTLGTRLIVASGYAADGLRNLMVTLDEQQKVRPPAWLSSHPGGDERVKYLETLISRNNYNRFRYEGVEKHQEIQARVKKILKEKQQREEKPEQEEKKDTSE